MHLSTRDPNNPDSRAVGVSLSLPIASLVFVIILGFGLAFHEALGDWLASFRSAPADSLRGEWVGTMDVPDVYDPWVRPVGKQAVIRFTLSPTEHFLHKYGGEGEITVAGEAPREVKVSNLWPSGTGTQRFEAALTLVPYKAGDPSDLISGGFEGTFKPGALTLERQRARGYGMQGTLHKGTDDEYSMLVREMTQSSKP